MKIFTEAPIKLGASLLVVVIALTVGCNRTPPERSAAISEHPEASQLDSSNELLAATFSGQGRLVRRALDNGANPNTTGEDGRTPLMLAAFNGHTETVRLLLARGAELDTRDPAGRTALMYASSGPNQQTVRLLLGFGANPLSVDSEEQFTALMFAASEGQIEIVEALLEQGSDSRMVDIDGDDALDFAIQNGHTEVAALLKELRDLDEQTL